MGIKRAWSMKCTITPVVSGATGILKKGLKKNLEAIPGKHSIDSLQTATLATPHIIWKVLQCETGSLGGVDYRWFKGNTREKRPATKTTTI